MRVLFRQDMQKADDLLTTKGCLTPELLMEMAGLEACLKLERLFSFPLKVAVFAGPGHNGADALVLARHLAVRGHRVFVFLLTSPEKLKPLSCLQLERLACLKTPIQPWSHFLPFEAHQCIDLIVEGLFGIGLMRDLDTEAITLIDTINRSQCFTISIDIPSGLDANLGRPRPVAVRADVTFALGRPKLGCYMDQGPLFCGLIQVIPLSLSSRFLSSLPKIYLWKKRHTQGLFPRRSLTDHKGLFGHVGVAGGWHLKTRGAFWLAAKAASRIGAGYVTWLTQGLEPFAENQSEFLQSPWEKANPNVWLVGPGIGDGKEVVDLLRRLRNQKEKRVLVDADALAFLHLVAPLPKSWIITPHLKELSVIIGKPLPWVKENRFEAAQIAHEKLGCIVVAKGPFTLIVSLSTTTLNSSGNPSLAKAGSGDVLSGIIAGLWAQGMTATASARVGTFIHGYIADQWLNNGLDAASLTPFDLIEAIPRALSQLKENNI